MPPRLHQHWTLGARGVFRIERFYVIFRPSTVYHIINKPTSLSFGRLAPACNLFLFKMNHWDGSRCVGHSCLVLLVLLLLLLLSSSSPPLLLLSSSSSPPPPPPGADEIPSFVLGSLAVSVPFFFRYADYAEITRRFISQIAVFIGQFPSIALVKFVSSLFCVQYSPDWTFVWFIQPPLHAWQKSIGWQIWFDLVVSGFVSFLLTEIREWLGITGHLAGWGRPFWRSRVATELWRGLIGQTRRMVEGTQC